MNVKCTGRSKGATVTRTYLIDVSSIRQRGACVDPDASDADIACDVAEDLFVEDFDLDDDQYEIEEVA